MGKGVNITDEQRLSNDRGAMRFKSYVDFGQKAHQDKMNRQNKKKKRR